MRKVIVTIIFLSLSMCLIGCQINENNPTPENNPTLGNNTTPNDPLQIIRNENGKIVYSVIALGTDSYELKYNDLHHNKSIDVKNQNLVFNYLREILDNRESVYSHTNCSMDYSIEVLYEVYGDVIENSVDTKSFSTYEFKFHTSCCSMTILKNDELVGTVTLTNEEVDVLLGYMLSKEDNIYSLTVKNLVDYELFNIKSEYKEGGQIEVKMEYIDDVVCFVYLNGQNVGYLNGHNSLYINMPDKDSELIISYESKIEKGLTFYDLFGYTIDTATKIIIDDGPGSIAPPWMHYVYEVNDSKEIETFLENLNNITLEKTIAMPGVGTRDITIITNDQEYNIFFTNRNEIWCNGNLYKFNSDLPKLNGKLIYQYYEGISDSTISIFGEEFNLPSNYFKDIKFLPYSPKMNTIFATKFGIINIDGLSLMLTSKDTFMDVNGNTYTIVGNKDFSDLLEGVNIETVRVQVKVSESYSYTIIVSKGVEYSLEELKRALLFLYDPYVLLMEDGSEFNSLLITDNITLLFSR